MKDAKAGLMRLELGDGRGDDAKGYDKTDFSLEDIHELIAILEIR